MVGGTVALAAARMTGSTSPRRRATRSAVPAPDRHAAAVLTRAFSADPWARHVTGGSPTARHAVMAFAIAHARCHGGVVAADAAAAVWLPSTARHLDARAVLAAGGTRLAIRLGLRRLVRLARDGIELDRIIDQHQHPRDAYLWLLGVDPDARGRGLGRHVATAVANAASAAGHRRLMLNPTTLTTCRSTDRSASNCSTVSRGDPGSSLTS
jgi:ribosomal protein S18 acetylase RimI-like enzyme